jgi:hypothetical protein
MSKLSKLVRDFKTANKYNPTGRIVDALEMIEYVLQYPIPTGITEDELRKVEQCIQHVINESDDVRLCEIISKWWDKKEQLRKLAERSHRISNDYIDRIHYHEEIAKIRRVKTEILQGPDSEAWQ